MIEPLHAQVLIREKKQTTSKGGIVLPENMNDAVRRGVAVAVGRGAWVEGKFIEPRIEASKIVLFSQRDATVVERDEAKGDLLLVSYFDLLATES